MALTLRLTALRPLLLVLAVLLMSLTATTAAQDPASQLTIYNDSKKYAYHGCYNETTEIPGSDHTRALGGGINEVKRGEMTVPMCLAFCSNGDTQYRYAGLEWARCVFSHCLIYCLPACLPACPSEHQPHVSPRSSVDGGQGNICPELSDLID